MLKSKLKNQNVTFWIEKRLWSKFYRKHGKNAHSVLREFIKENLKKREYPSENVLEGRE